MTKEQNLMNLMERTNAAIDDILEELKAAHPEGFPNKLRVEIGLLREVVSDYAIYRSWYEKN